MTPIDEVDDPAQVRTALIDQLQYLIEEIEALKGIVDLVPEPIREGRPQPGAPSIKEIYGIIAHLNEAVFPERLDRMVDTSAETPAFDPIDNDALAEAEAWNDEPLRDLLDRIQVAREELVETFDALEPDDWTSAGQFDGEERDVYEFAYDIIQDDTQRLQAVSQRLHQSNLTGRERDLPK